MLRCRTHRPLFLRLRYRWEIRVFGARSDWYHFSRLHMIQSAHCTLQVLFTYYAYFTVSARVCFIPRENKLGLSRNWRRTVIANGWLGDSCIISSRWPIDSLRFACVGFFWRVCRFIFFLNPPSVNYFCNWLQVSGWTRSFTHRFVGNVTPVNVTSILTQI